MGESERIAKLKRRIAFVDGVIESLWNLFASSWTILLLLCFLPLQDNPVSLLKDEVFRPVIAMGVGLIVTRPRRKP